MRGRRSEADLTGIDGQRGGELRRQCGDQQTGDEAQLHGVDGGGDPTRWSGLEERKRDTHVRLAFAHEHKLWCAANPPWGCGAQKCA